MAIWSPPPSGGNGRGVPSVRTTGAHLLLVAILIGFFAVSGGAPAALAQEGGGATVDATTPVNLRAEPGAWSGVVGQVFGGQAVMVLAGPTVDGWYQVEVAGQIGWLHGWYVLAGGGLAWATPPLLGPEVPAAADEMAALPVEEIAPPFDPATGGVSVDAAPAPVGLNVYTAPDEWSGILGVVGQGEPVTVTGEAVNGYVPVDSWSGSGWVWGELLPDGSVPLGIGGPVSPAMEPAPWPESPAELIAVATSERWVDVNRSTQMVTLYEGGTPIAAFWGAMGRDQSMDGFFATANGTHFVYEKYRDLSWTVWGNVWVRDWVGFDPARANGFHSYSMDWAGQVIPSGAGPTNGCVALDPSASSALFDFVQLGTRVEVHW